MLRVFILFILFSLSLSVIAQSSLGTKNKKAIELYTEADNYRVRGQFEQAINLLNKAIEKDRNFVEAYYRLGLVYYSMRNYTTAVENFERGLQLTNEKRKQKVFWYDLGDAYLKIGAYDKAEKVLSAFMEAEVPNSRKAQQAQVLLRNARFALKYEEANSRYNQHPLSDVVNRFGMQYFPVLTADQEELIFTRRLGNSEVHDEDLVISRKDAKGEWTVPVSISDSINTVLNEGTCTISADGRKLIFTSCEGRGGYGSCDLYESRKIGNKWTRPVNLGDGVNSSEWESQPSLSADGRTLYFVSDRRGGYGRRDIWVSHLSVDGKWIKAVNAGPQVNTVYEEISPFIHVNNRTLYFASNGLTGFGGFDVFFVEKDSGGWSPPQNVGPPINDHEDQFSLFITADGKKAYYSHEEMSTEGYAAGKIYVVDIPEEDQIRYRSNYVKGIVRDKDTGQVLKAEIELINIGNDQVESIVESDSLSGQYLIVLTQGAEYALYINKPGYLFKSLNFNYSQVEDFEPIIMNIDLEKAKEGSVSVLKNIFFKFNEYELQEKSKTELQKIIRFLNNNPGLRVEISGHTDNIGSASYNYQLSDKRARAVYDFLVSEGIQPQRLVSKGYGADHPVATNDTEEGRQLNRRIEFKVIK